MSRRGGANPLAEMQTDVSTTTTHALIPANLRREDCVASS